MNCALGLFAVFVIETVFAEDSSIGEYSRFQFDHELLKKIVEIEHDHGVMQYLLKGYQQLEDTNMETAKILEAQGNLIRSLQNDLDQEKQETKSKLEAHDTKLDAQQSALRMYEELRQNVNETMTKLNVNDVRKLKDDAEKHSEDILKLKGVSKDRFAKITSLQAEVKSHEKAITDLKTKNKETSGYVGGGHYSHSGAAVNYLCLTKKPTWNHTTTVYKRAYLYGTEYEISSQSNAYFGQNLHEHDSPCAVCRSTRASVIMIPGTNVCAKGWTTEYVGYLVAGASNHAAASEFICLDSMATTAEGSSSTNHNGKLMYLVNSQCGALKCPPYVDGREVTCAVCTR